MISVIIAPGAILGMTVLVLTVPEQKDPAVGPAGRIRNTVVNDGFQW